MSIKYKLVQKRNLGSDQEQIPTKIYAQMVSGDLVTFDEFVEEVADSTVAGSAGVKAILDRFNVVLVRHLRNGRRVQVGELGNFRLNMGSTGVATVEDFSTDVIREPRVRFHPGKALRAMKGNTNFERFTVNNSSTDVDSSDENEEPEEL